MTIAVKDINSEEGLELARLECLRSFNILDTEVEKELDDLTRLAALICGAPISIISLIDKDRQWFKSKFGIDVAQTERCVSFCHYTIMDDKVMEVKNALIDDRFTQNPFVTGGLMIRFYCGAPLISPEGMRIGSLCVIDQKPRELNEYQKSALQVLANQIVTHFELRRQKNLLEKKVEERTAELKDINHELNTIIYKSSHDLRGPIATIMGLSDLGMITSNSSESSTFFDNITKTSLRLDQTLKNLIQLIQVKDNAIDISNISGEELENDLKELINYFSASLISIACTVPPNFNVATDKVLLLTIIKCMVDNSIKFSIQGKRDSFINIRISQTKAGAIITIEDNGEGIEDEVKDKIFNMFYRANERSRGAGLGLYIVKKAVIKLRGSITFESKLFQGTTFNVFLPNLN